MREDDDTEKSPGAPGSERPQDGATWRRPRGGGPGQRATWRWFVRSAPVAPDPSSDSDPAA